MWRMNTRSATAHARGATNARKEEHSSDGKGSTHTCATHDTCAMRVIGWICARIGAYARATHRTCATKFFNKKSINILRRKI